MLYQVEIINNFNLNDLIDIKFIIEQNIRSNTSNILTLVDFNLDESLLLYNLDIYSVFVKYKENISTTGSIFLEKQKELQKTVDKILLDQCLHNWISDIVDEPFGSRNICYCSNCFIYKNLK